jgi:hypothetical protein
MMQRLRPECQRRCIKVYAQQKTMGVLSRLVERFRFLLLKNDSTTAVGNPKKLNRVRSTKNGQLHHAAATKNP